MFGVIRSLWNCRRLHTPGAVQEWVKWPWQFRRHAVRVRLLGVCVVCVNMSPLGRANYTLGKTFWVCQQRFCDRRLPVVFGECEKHFSVLFIHSIISCNNGFGLWPICCSIKTLFLLIVVVPRIQSLLLAARDCVSCKSGQLISTDRGNAVSPPAPLHSLYGSTN